MVSQKHFDDLYFALTESNFQTNCEVILVYDWTGDGRDWFEIDYEKQEWFKFVSAVLGGDNTCPLSKFQKEI